MHVSVEISPPLTLTLTLSPTLTLPICQYAQNKGKLQERWSDVEQERVKHKIDSWLEVTIRYPCD